MSLKGHEVMAEVLSLKQGLKRFYSNYNSFMAGNDLVKRAVYWQHRHLPLPYTVFELLFKFRPLRKLLNFYGSLCFDCDYKAREDNLSFWLSKRSLYWHFWRQTEVDVRIFNEVFSMPEVKSFLSDSSLTAAEIGFGIGKNYKHWLRHNTHFKQYMAVDPNSFVCEYIKRRFPKLPVIVLNMTIREFTKANYPFDVLLVFGGTFMGFDKKDVDDFFDSLPGKGVKKILIVNEGTAGDDWVRSDHTTMYNFRTRLSGAGYKQTFIEKEQPGNPRILEYFIMV